MAEQMLCCELLRFLKKLATVDTNQDILKQHLRHFLLYCKNVVIRTKSIERYMI